MTDKLNELKLILEAGDNAKEAALIYFAVDLAGMLLWFIGAMVVVAVLYKILSRALLADKIHKDLETIAEALGTKKRGVFTDSEREDTMDRLHELIREQRKTSDD